MKWPNSDSSSSPTGFSSETGVCEVRRICSTSSIVISSSSGDLRGARLPALLGPELALGAEDLVQLLDHVHRHADRAALVGERPRDGLADPPRGVGRELEALAVVELLGGAHEPDRPLLDQVEERQALVAVALGDRDDEAEVRLDHLLLGAVVAALDPLRELDLLRRGEQLGPCPMSLRKSCSESVVISSSSGSSSRIVEVASRLDRQSSTAWKSATSSSSSKNAARLSSVNRVPVFIDLLQLIALPQFGLAGQFRRVCSSHPIAPLTCAASGCSGDSRRDGGQQLSARPDGLLGPEGDSLGRRDRIGLSWRVPRSRPPRSRRGPSSRPCRSRCRARASPCPRTA